MKKIKQKIHKAESPPYGELLAIIFLVTFFVGVNLFINKVFPRDVTRELFAAKTLNIEAKLTNATIKHKRIFGTRVNLVEANLEIINNSTNSIGLDPNNCDYDIYVNNKKINRNQKVNGEFVSACTAIGGISVIKQGEKSNRKVFYIGKQGKAGDKIYVSYGYNVIRSIRSGSDYAYGFEKVVSNTVVIK